MSAPPNIASNPLPPLPRPQPQRITLAGSYVVLEPISAEKHLDSLWDAVNRPSEVERFRYLFEEHPSSKEELYQRLLADEKDSERLVFAAVDKASGKCEGYQALMRIVPAFGVIEIGNIYWGPNLAQTRLATEALFLQANYALSTLGYRRLEWKCDSLNAPSRRAALRFGFKFEGIFAQHMVIKGKNRDTAWFSMLDRDWPALSRRYQNWLDPNNFDQLGKQKKPLNDY